MPPISFPTCPELLVDMPNVNGFGIANFCYEAAPPPMLWDKYRATSLSASSNWIENKKRSTNDEKPHQGWHPLAVFMLVLLAPLVLVFLVAWVWLLYHGLKGYFGSASRAKKSSTRRRQVAHGRCDEWYGPALAAQPTAGVTGSIMRQAEVHQLQSTEAIPGIAWPAQYHRARDPAASSRPIELAPLRQNQYATDTFGPSRPTVVMQDQSAEAIPFPAPGAGPHLLNRCIVAITNSARPHPAHGRQHTATLTNAVQQASVRQIRYPPAIPSYARPVPFPRAEYVAHGRGPLMPIQAAQPHHTLNIASHAQQIVQHLGTYDCESPTYSDTDVDTPTAHPPPPYSVEPDGRVSFPVPAYIARQR